MIHDSYEDIIDRLPDDETTIENAQATLVFIGEAWINGYAIEVDDGRTEFDVPMLDLRDPDGEWAIHPTGGGYHVDDVLRLHKNAPEWVQTWRGPFTIKLKTWGV